MADLTNKKEDVIVIKLDAKAEAAFDTWKSGLSNDDKTKFTKYDNGLIMCPPDPTDSLKVERDELIELVNANADTPTAVVRLNFEGPSFAAIIMLVADPDNEEPK